MSLSREEREEFERDSMPESSTIAKCTKTIKEMDVSSNHNTDGGKTNFYDIDGCSDVDALCEHWGLSFAEGNCLKAIVGIAKARDGEVRHDGTSASRDAKKLLHYAGRVLNTVKK